MIWTISNNHNNKTKSILSYKKLNLDMDSSKTGSKATQGQDPESASLHFSWVSSFDHKMASAMRATGLHEHVQNQEEWTAA